MKTHTTSGEKDPRRQVRGAVSRAAGKLFEQRLDNTFAYYRETGAAIIEKTPEPMRPTESLGNGRFVAYFEKKAQPDYKGTIKGGRTVMFEAKFTSSVKMEQNRVTPGQAEYLDQHQALGARCYIVAGFSTGNVYRFPWPIWRDMKAHFGRKYISESDPALRDFKVLQTRDGIMLLLD